MMSTNFLPELNIRPEFDQEIQDIAHYVLNYQVQDKESIKTAWWCLLDSIGCALLSLNYPECTKLLGPIIKGDQLKNGARIPGTNYQLDPVQAAFNIGTMIRWLDFNDTWLAQEWGHPSDNLGGILAMSDYLGRSSNGKKYNVSDILKIMVKAHEIQGILALENSFNRFGIDHVIYVKVATSAVVTHLLGGNFDQICSAVSNAFLDGHPLRTYRHSPNTGSRKSWAAGDATSRGVWLALISMREEMGYPSALTASKWGVYDVYLNGETFKFSRTYDEYVMKNVLFKISYPAEFHAQTVAECGVKLHPLLKDRLDDIERVSIRTQESAMRILNKRGQLYNPADRDHCLQYILAVTMIYGTLTADHYEDKIASDIRIDTLRNKMEVLEDERFSRDYLDPEKRSIANAVQVFFRDGTSTEEIEIEYPIGHKKRREEGIPLLLVKLKNNLATRFSKEKVDRLMQSFENDDEMINLSINNFMDLFVTT